MNFLKYDFIMLILLLLATFLKVDAKEVVLPHSLTELDSAALVLRMAFDGDKESGCGLDKAEASNLLKVVQARLDSKRKSLLKAPYGKGWPTQAELKNCDVDCHCGVYSTLLEANKHVKAGWETAYEFAQKKAQDQGEAESKKCAKKAVSFCSSALFKSLRKEAKEMASDSTPESNY